MLIYRRNDDMTPNGPSIARSLVDSFLGTGRPLSVNLSLPVRTILTLVVSTAEAATSGHLAPDPSQSTPTTVSVNGVGFDLPTASLCIASQCRQPEHVQ